MARNFTVGVEIVATDRASGAIEDVETRIDRLRSGAGNLAAAAGPALATLAAQLVAVGAAAQQAGEQEEALVALAQALQGVAGGAEEALGALQRQADELQRGTRFTDDQINQAQARIASFVKEADAIKLLTQLSADFAAAKKIDVVTAADLLTKSVASETNALARYGIAVEGAANSTERLASVAKGVSEAFGGQAAAAADTYAGRIDRLSKAFGELVETWGSTIIEAPRVNSVIDGIAGAIERYTDRVKELLEADKDREGVLDAQSEAFERQMASMVQAQTILEGLAEKTREAAAETERLAAAQSAEIAASDAFIASLKALGVTLESDVNEKFREHAEVLERADEAYRRGEITRRDFEAIERAVADANREATESLAAAVPAMDAFALSTTEAAAATVNAVTATSNLPPALIAASAQLRLSASDFDRLKESTLGYAAAVEMALAAGAQLTQGGTRIRFGASGSRLANAPGLTSQRRQSRFSNLGTIV